MEQCRDPKALRLPGPEQTVSGIAHPGKNEAVLVDLRIDGGGEDLDVSGWASWKRASPEADASRVTKRIERGCASFSRSTAATAEWPVAIMGSTMIASRSSISSGSLK
jgi:hypothetical protein